MGGGISRLLTEYVRASGDETDWRVVVRARGDSHNEVAYAASARALVREVNRSSSWLRSASDRLVVCGHAYLTPIALMAGQRSRTPVGALAYGRELMPQRLTHHIPLSALRAADSVVAISRRTAEAVEALGVPRRKVRIVAPVLLPPWFPVGRTASRPASAAECCASELEQQFVCTVRRRQFAI